MCLPLVPPGQKLGAGHAEEESSTEVGSPCLPYTQKWRGHGEAVQGGVMMCLVMAPPQVQSEPALALHFPWMLVKSIIKLNYWNHSVFGNKQNTWIFVVQMKFVQMKFQEVFSLVLYSGM